MRHPLLPRSRRGRVLTLTLAAGALLPVAAAPAEPRPVRNVAIVYDGPGPTGAGPEHYMELAALLVRETTELTRRDLDVQFPERFVRGGNWERSELHQVVDELLADDDVHAIVAMGPLGTVDVCSRGPVPKPVLAPFAIDIGALGLPSTVDDRGVITSGVHDLNYLVTPGSVVRDLQLFRQITDFRRVDILVDELLLEALPQLQALAGEYGKELGAELRLVGVGASAEEALRLLPADSEAVYVSPLYRFTDEEIDRLIDGLNRRMLPTFSLLGRDEVERGMLAGARPSTSSSRIARRVALNLQRALAGEDPGDFSVVLEGQDRLTINAATMREINQPIPWRTIIESDLLHEEPAGGRALSLDVAVRQAIAANLSLRARLQDVTAGAENIEQARSAYKPFVDLAVSGVVVDQDRASASFGSLSQRTASGNLGVSQLIYSDAALTGISVNRSLQTARERDWDGLRMDIALEAAVAFLDVLRAENQEKATRENLDLTEENLQLARNREQIGFSGPADVYRWESELAAARILTIRAVQYTRATRLNLNRLMHRPQREPFTETPPKLDDSSLISGVGRLAPYIDNAMAENRFTEFLVEEGLADSFELAALDAAIAAQERTSLGRKRSYWAPQISFDGEFRRLAWKGGAGSEPVAPIPGLPLLDDNVWSAGLFATLPLYTGGQRGSLFRQSNDELAALHLQRAALAESIELEVRVNMTRVGSTFPAITLSREAADSSRHNLELVTDSYSRGVVSIIDLLDAQNSAIRAELDAANAEYDFLIDLMTLQRSITNIGFLMTADERELWFERLERFFEESTTDGQPTETP